MMRRSQINPQTRMMSQSTVTKTAISHNWRSWRCANNRFPCRHQPFYRGRHVAQGDDHGLRAAQQFQNLHMRHMRPEMHPERLLHQPFTASTKSEAVVVPDG